MGIISFIAVSALIIFFSGFFTFFIDRLNFSGNNQNLSVLVFLSGYERAYLTFSESYMLGVGFQQMGIIGPLGKFQIAIMAITAGGVTMNTLDGGTLFSKLVTEFGMFGFALVLAYVAMAIRVFRSRRRLFSEDYKGLFYTASFLSFFILIFIRSVNYFSPSFFIFLIALIGLSKLASLPDRYTKDFYK